MDVLIKGNAQISKLLNEWYKEIRSRNIDNAHCLKEEINSIIHNNEADSNLLLYYHLLDFGYKYLVDNLSISKNSFDKIESFDIPTDNFLSYYYHFYKAIHSNAVGNYNLAKEQYDKAELLLKHIPDELEKAEFHYNLATYHYHIYQALLAIKHGTKARDIFSKHESYELKTAYCDNLLGLACTHLKEFELAEEYFVTAMNTFQKQKNEKAILLVRHNLGLMYASQNLSSSAIRYLSEVVEKKPHHYKAIFVKAKEHVKLGEKEIACQLIEKGLTICNELGNQEYQYRFAILRELNKKAAADKLEKAVLAGMDYFRNERLWEYVQEYTEALAVQFHSEGNFEQGSKYFYLSYEAKKEIFNKEALK
ncbi:MULTISPECIES: tetratricopeptide repeat protein [Bacillus cereus group]|uniref:response regulator aspartate phosphatase n=1 Tax=Bacillus cereus group TaxID=86661 RepID=UPI0008A81E0E|nr:MULTISPECIES: tetratricopeptide repeat protein [Bacillus cereus group]AOY17785.1 histidine kinase [Bacillus sp. ABP14]MCU5469053.1 tetratricopeptide repeat protein [Bacillus paranthracis]WAI28130.1 MAG: tetratricopeptide repeat protein [Bacillus paranthracis]WAI34066.1 MAG: tetratricopeptide repeat protein [Bacillus paranthracis]WAI37805.1 MAG: tetratricopeptide repeat protein [Bacillus paranthracis]